MKGKRKERGAGRSETGEPEEVVGEHSRTDGSGRDDSDTSGGDAKSKAKRRTKGKGKARTSTGDRDSSDGGLGDRADERGSSTSSLVCTICFEHETDEDNPLVSALCCKAISHRACVERWLMEASRCYGCTGTVVKSRSMQKAYLSNKVKPGEYISEDAGEGARHQLADPGTIREELQTLRKKMFEEELRTSEQALEQLLASEAGQGGDDAAFAAVMAQQEELLSSLRPASTQVADLEASEALARRLEEREQARAEEAARQAESELAASEVVARELEEQERRAEMNAEPVVVKKAVSTGSSGRKRRRSRSGPSAGNDGGAAAGRGDSVPSDSIADQKGRTLASGSGLAGPITSGTRTRPQGGGEGSGSSSSSDSNSSGSSATAPGENTSTSNDGGGSENNNVAARTSGAGVLSDRGEKRKGRSSLPPIGNSMVDGHSRANSATDSRSSSNGGENGDGSSGGGSSDSGGGDAVGSAGTEIARSDRSQRVGASADGARDDPKNRRSATRGRSTSSRATVEEDVTRAARAAGSLAPASSSSSAASRKRPRAGDNALGSSGSPGPADDAPKEQATDAVGRQAASSEPDADIVAAEFSTGGTPEATPPPSEATPSPERGKRESASVRQRDEAGRFRRAQAPTTKADRTTGGSPVGDRQSGAEISDNPVSGRAGVRLEPAPSATSGDASTSPNGGSSRNNSRRERSRSAGPAAASSSVDTDSSLSRSGSDPGERQLRNGDDVSDRDGSKRATAAASTSAEIKADPADGLKTTRMLVGTVDTPLDGARSASLAARVADMAAAVVRREQERLGAALGLDTSTPPIAPEEVFAVDTFSSYGRAAISPRSPRTPAQRSMTSTLEEFEHSPAAAAWPETIDLT